MRRTKPTFRTYYLTSFERLDTFCLPEFGMNTSSFIPDWENMYAVHLFSAIRTETPIIGVKLQG